MNPAVELRDWSFRTDPASVFCRLTQYGSVGGAEVAVRLSVSGVRSAGG
ncbi:MAG: hypothetical protein LBT40_07375 [Deltaproteobacteria bacterium]|nr:hypothetical protein [Deltaproteobacteria bacterium]